MRVPLLDLRPQYAQIQDEVEPIVLEICRSQAFILGSKVQECEAAVAAYCGVEYAVGVTSGSDALLLALMAEEIGPGDEVITTPYTFFGTVGAIARRRAKPVFVDIDPVTFNLDTTQLEAAVTPRTKAILPVHLYGQVADMARVMAVAQKYGLVVIEDAAQAIGAEWNGQRAGSIGDYGCFSFYPSKNLGCFGDGGMVTLRDAGKVRKTVALRNHGSEAKYCHELVGGNFRLDALQAGVLTVKMKYLDTWTAARKANAERYRRLFAEKGGAVADHVVLPAQPAHRHTYNQFVIRAQRRDALQAYLCQCGIGVAIYYPVPLHLQACFQSLGYVEGDFPESERAAKETLALPIYPDLTDANAERVVDCIAAFYERGAPRSGDR